LTGEKHLKISTCGESRLAKPELNRRLRWIFSAGGWRLSKIHGG